MLHPRDTLIITGASRGIGRELALGLARQGLNLVLGARGRERLTRAAEDCRRAGARVDWLEGSAADDSVAAGLVERARGLGGFRGFIHAAGVLHPGPFIWEMPAERAREVMEASYHGALSLIRAAVPALLEREDGLAVFFGSGAAERNQVGIGVYCAAKAAEEFIARQLAAETRRVTTIIYRPAVAETRMQAEAREAVGGAAEQVRRHFKAYQSDGRLLSPEQAAGALIRALMGDHRPLHGRTLNARDYLT